MWLRVCPWWLGYFLICPYRKKLQDTEAILSPYLKPGMKAVDFGSAMGFFSLTMAKLVGDSGKVYCIDIQKRMLSRLMKRATKSGFEKIIETKLVEKKENNFVDLKNTADFALLFAVAHEVPDREMLFKDLYNILKSGGILLFSEPSDHVKKEAFEKSLSFAMKTGFSQKEELTIKGGRSVLLEKK